MILDFFTYLLRFVLIILVQVWVINNIQLSTYINPYIYVMFILTLPVSAKPWLILILSTLTGLVMDTFSSTPGLHMAATIFMGYFRRFYLDFATNKEDREAHIAPTLSAKGPIWFTVYIFIMVFLHHLILFFLEIYGFSEFFRTIWRVIVSTSVTVLIILLAQLLFYRNRNSSQ